MDMVRPESDLMRPPYPTHIIRRLEYRVITPTGSCRLIPGSERSGDGEYQYLRQSRCVIKILHAEIAQVIEIVYGFLAECSKRCRMEGIHNSRTPHVRITQNKRLSAHLLIALQQRKRTCTVVGRGRVEACKFIAAEHGMFFAVLVVDLAHDHMFVALDDLTISN